MRADQLRLTFSAFAGALFTLLRQVGLQGTAPARARADTIRARLLKVAARITVTVRKDPGRVPVRLPAAGAVRARARRPARPAGTRRSRLTRPAAVLPPPAARAATGATEAVCPAPAIQRDPSPESGAPGSIAPDSGDPGRPGTASGASKPTAPPPSASSGRRQVRW